VQDVELAITLLYQLGEGAAEETLKPGSGTLGQLATGAPQLCCILNLLHLVTLHLDLLSISFLLCFSNCFM